MNLLHTIGLMTRAEHKRTLAYSQNMEKAAAETAELWEAKFKRAATDLADALHNNEQQAQIIVQLDADVAALRPDAEAMRKKRAADRKRMAGKRGAA